MARRSPKKQGRPRKPPSEAKGKRLQIRVDEAEKQAFSESARLMGQDVAVWVRDQLRRAARHILEEFGRPVPFNAGVPGDDALK